MPDQAAQVLASLAEGLNVEKQEAYEDQEFLDDEVDDPPLDQWVDLHNGMTDEEKEEINLNVQLVQTMLTKVRGIICAQS